MNNINITEKYILCILKEKKNLYVKEVKPYIIVSMIIEMMMDENLEIIDKDKIKLNEKEPTANYNKKLYEIITNMKKEKIPLRNILMSICFGLSLKNIKNIINLLTESMEKNGLITIEKKKGLLGDKEIININENKLKDIIGEIKTEFLENGNFTDDLILLTSLLNSTKFLKNIFSKYEREEIKDKLKEIENTDIAEKVKVAQSTINFMNSMIVTTMVNSTTV